MALEISQKRTMVLEQRRNRGGAVRSVHYQIVLAPRFGPVAVRYAEDMSARAFSIVLSLAIVGCGESEGPTSPTGPTSTATLRLVFMGSTTRRTDLPVSAQACVNGVGATHTHPSWRSFAGISLQAVLQTGTRSHSPTYPSTRGCRFG
jgi:hypothetical protein